MKAFGFKNAKGATGTGILLFFGFILVQLVTRSLAGGAVSAGLWLYPLLPVAGFLLHLPLHRWRVGLLPTALLFLAAGNGVLLFLPEDPSLFQWIAGALLVCLGGVAGETFRRLAALTARGARAGVCFGVGCAAAEGLAHLIRLRREWRLLPAVLLALGLLLLALTLAGKEEVAPRWKRAERRIPLQKLLITAGISLSLLFFFYWYDSALGGLGSYVSHPVYDENRLYLLLTVPALLLFGSVWEIKGGRFLPICVLLLSLAALLSGLAQTAYLLPTDFPASAYLYYPALGGIVAYCHLAFLVLAPRTRHPGLWASLGWATAGLAEGFFLLLRPKTSAPVAALILDVAALALAAVLMGANGDLFLGRILRKEPEDPLLPMREDFGLTPGEMRVLRGLTAGEPEDLAAGLRISEATLQRHVKSLCRKTGVRSPESLRRLAEVYRQEQ